VHEQCQRDVLAHPQESQAAVELGLRAFHQRLDLGGMLAQVEHVDARKLGQAGGNSLDDAIGERHAERVAAVQDAAQDGQRGNRRRGRRDVLAAARRKRRDIHRHPRQFFGPVRPGRAFERQPVFEFRIGDVSALEQLTLGAQPEALELGRVGEYGAVVDPDLLQVERDLVGGHAQRLVGQRAEVAAQLEKRLAQAGRGTALVRPAPQLVAQPDPTMRAARRQRQERQHRLPLAVAHDDAAIRHVAQAEGADDMEPQRRASVGVSGSRHRARTVPQASRPGRGNRAGPRSSQPPACRAVNSGHCFVLSCRAYHRITLCQPALGPR